MAHILGTAKAIPPYNIEQAAAREFARLHFKSRHGDMERLLGIFASSRIEQRQFCVPQDWFSSPKSFQEKNEAYIEWACRLGEEASRSCLDNAGVSVGEVDHIIFVSSTGLATPSIDARLINLMKFRSNIIRVPVWGLGCVGGAAGLSMADDYIRAYPHAKVLLVAVELCGLTFQSGDFSKSNLVATALFADGAAAILLGGEGNGLEIMASQSTIWPDTLDIMGWNVLNEGLQVVFAKAIPTIVNKYSRADFTKLVSSQGLSLDDVEYYLLHPGGAKVIDAYKSSLGMRPEAVKFSEAVLRLHGNMSAVTVLYVIDDFIRSAEAGPGKYCFVSALGPGFSSQSMLLKT